MSIIRILSLAIFGFMFLSAFLAGHVGLWFAAIDAALLAATWYAIFCIVYAVVILVRRAVDAMRGGAAS